MQEFFGSVWWLIVSLGLLVTFHEFGHYWVARRCGVRVLRFSVGFGRALWKRVGRDGTEYVIAAIPLGGYVKMLDEREADVPAHQLDQAFNRKSVWKRFAIVAAGPIANLLLAFVLLWGMFLIGKSDFAPVVGQSSGIAAESGLQPGDRIVMVGGKSTPTWTDAMGEIVIAAIDREPLPLQVEAADQRRRDLNLDLSRLPADFDQSRPLDAIGIAPEHWSPAPRIGSVGEESPAARAGLLPGDTVIAIGPTPISSWPEIPKAINAQAGESTPVSVRVKRAGGSTREFLIQPERQRSGGESRWILGIGHDTEVALLRYGPLRAVGAAWDETGNLFGKTTGLLWRMVNGSASLANISSPITIAQVANATANIGPDWFLSFLAMLSVSLCIMNLLPIPILDGGHLLFYLVEMVKGSPVSERVLEAGQYVGLALLAGLMGLAFYNDILRLVSS